jgi:hypothetical protein
MKQVLPLAALALVATTLHTPATAAENLNAIGIDLVRLIDQGQFEPDGGTMNLFYQRYLTKESALLIGYAWGEMSSIPEIAYKIYPQGYLNGSFWEIGLTTIDVDGTDYENDPAVLGAFGYERSPAENVIVSGSVKALAGIDHPHTGENDIVFQPSLSVMFSF